MVERNLPARETGTQKLLLDASVMAANDIVGDKMASLSGLRN
jgi:hypothetical protein